MVGDLVIGFIFVLVLLGIFLFLLDYVANVLFVTTSMLLTFGVIVIALIFTTIVLPYTYEVLFEVLNES